jgi:hypothetical protein
MIFIEKDEEQTRAQVEEKLALLSEAVREDEGKLCGGAVREALKRAVPTFREPKTE